MKKYLCLLLVLIFSVGLMFCVARTQTTKLNSDKILPKIFLINPNVLNNTRERILSNDPSLQPAFKKLLIDAEKSLKSGPFSVTFNEHILPSGDNHNYVSLGTYYWPNPKTADGLPYILRDGERNPEVDQYDRPQLNSMCEAVNTLALAYYFTGEEKYAEYATKLLRIWFLDENTKMNPNMKYSQACKGVNDGTCWGIIESSVFPEILDSVGMLAGSKSWTLKDEEGLKDWFNLFLQWLIESEAGEKTSVQKNNHGTYYDVLVVSIALYIDKLDFAKNHLTNTTMKRIENQIMPDGSQPFELKRTLSLDYSLSNLKGLYFCALLGENVGLDLWNYQTSDGRGINKALEYLLPYIKGEKKWEYKQMKEYNRTHLFFLLRLASIKFHNPDYETLLRGTPNAYDITNIYNLLYPDADFQQ